MHTHVCVGLFVVVFLLLLFFFVFFVLGGGGLGGIYVYVCVLISVKNTAI